MENYKSLRKIGKGSYGQVWLVRHVGEKKKYVMKVVKLRGLAAAERAATKNEVDHLQRLPHPNIVAYKDSFYVGREKLCIVMTYCDGGDLSQAIEGTRGALPEAQVLHWFVQAALGLQFMHANKVLHRDIKSQNIFLLGTGRLVLGDLGIAKRLDATKAMARTQIGTPYYMSPELFRNQTYSYAADVWALGCVLYEMCTRRHPFEARSIPALASKVTNSRAPPLPATYSRGLRELYLSMLERDPARRPSLSRVLCHPVLRRPLFDLVRDVATRATEGGGKVGDGTILLHKALARVGSSDSHRTLSALGPHARNLERQMQQLGLAEVVARALGNGSGSSSSSAAAGDGKSGDATPGGASVSSSKEKDPPQPSSRPVRAAAAVPSVPSVSRVEASRRSDKSSASERERANRARIAANEAALARERANQRAAEMALQRLNEEKRQRELWQKRRRELAAPKPSSGVPRSASRDSRGSRGSKGSRRSDAGSRRSEAGSRRSDGSSRRSGGRDRDLLVAGRGGMGGARGVGGGVGGGGVGLGVRGVRAQPVQPVYGSSSSSSSNNNNGVGRRRRSPDRKSSGGGGGVGGVGMSEARAAAEKIRLAREREAKEAEAQREKETVEARRQEAMADRAARMQEWQAQRGERQKRREVEAAAQAEAERRRREAEQRRKEEEERLAEQRRLREKQKFEELARERAEEARREERARREAKEREKELERIREQERAEEKARMKARAQKHGIAAALPPARFGSPTETPNAGDVFEKPDDGTAGNDDDFEEPHGAAEDDDDEDEEEMSDEEADDAEVIAALGVDEEDDEEEDDEIANEVAQIQAQLAASVRRVDGLQKQAQVLRDREARTKGDKGPIVEHGVEDDEEEEEDDYGKDFGFGFGDDIPGVEDWSDPYADAGAAGLAGGTYDDYAFAFDGLPPIGEDDAGDSFLLSKHQGSTALGVHEDSSTPPAGGSADFLTKRAEGIRKQCTEALGPDLFAQAYDLESKLFKRPDQAHSPDVEAAQAAVEDRLGPARLAMLQKVRSLIELEACVGKG